MSEDPAPTDLSVHRSADAAERTAVVRNAMRTIPPSDRIADVAELLEPLPVRFSNHRAVANQLERLTGLRTGELHALLAVADGARTVGELAEATGQVEKAAAATVEHLGERGLLRADDGGLRLTARARAAIEQAEALSIRMADVVSGVLGADQLDGARDAARAIGSRLSWAG